MNTIEKENQQQKITQNIKGIETATIAAIKSRDAHVEAMTQLTMHGRETFSAEYVDREMQKKKVEFYSQMQQAYKGVENRLEELRTLLHDRDAVLDLTNPALTNALMLIQSTNGNPSHEQAIQINENFRYDQSALRALYSAYGGRDLGNIGKMMYNLDETIDALQELARVGITQDGGSINFFANKFAQFAKIEGVTTEKTPDNRGYDDSIRRAAGLSVN